MRLNFITVCIRVICRPIFVPIKQLFEKSWLDYKKNVFTAVSFSNFCSRKLCSRPPIANRLWFRGSNQRLYRTPREEQFVGNRNCRGSRFYRFVGWRFHGTHSFEVESEESVILTENNDAKKVANLFFYLKISRTLRKSLTSRTVNTFFKTVYDNYLLI